MYVCMYVCIYTYMLAMNVYATIILVLIRICAYIHTHIHTYKREVCLHPYLLRIYAIDSVLVHYISTHFWHFPHMFEQDFSWAIVSMEANHQNGSQVQEIMQIGHVWVLDSLVGKVPTSQARSFQNEHTKKSTQGHQHGHEGQCEVLYTLHAQGNVLLAVKCFIHATRQEVFRL